MWHRGAVGLYNNGNVTLIGGGATNTLVGLSSSLEPGAGPAIGIWRDRNGCGHNFECLIAEFSDKLTTGDPCSKPSIVNQPARYYFAPTWDPWFSRFQSLNLMNAATGNFEYVHS